jgi:hypothetical protein
MAADLDYDLVDLALTKLHAGQPISEDEKELVESLMDALMPGEDVPEPVVEDEVVEPVEENSGDMLALKRKKLALMELLETL